MKKNEQINTEGFAWLENIESFEDMEWKIEKTTKYELWQLNSKILRSKEASEVSSTIETDFGKKIEEIDWKKELKDESEKIKSIFNDLVRSEIPSHLKNRSPWVDEEIMKIERDVQKYIDEAANNKNWFLGGVWKIMKKIMEKEISEKT